SLAKANAHSDGTLSDEALSTIVQALTDWDADARAAAARALGDLGARAKGAVPTLERMILRDPVAWVAEAAASTIGRIEPDRAFPKARRRGVPFGPF
ncbi:MAG: HEAT repeat domain-containing protein, partial [Planctomycetota bacterium]